MATHEVFLSARVAFDLRDRFKASALRQGLKVQDHLRAVVLKHLNDEQSQTPNPTHIIKTLQSSQADIKAQGIKHLSLVGSVARNQAHDKSDIDLLIEFDQGVSVTLTRLSHAQNLFQDILGDTHKVDVTMTQGIEAKVAKTMRADEIVIF